MESNLAVSVAETLDELRSALAAALEDAALAERAVADNQAAQKRAASAVAEAVARLDEAQTGIAEAKENFVIAAVDGAAPAAGSMMLRQARVAVQTEEDALDAARQALDRIRALRPDLEEESRVAKHHVEKAVNQIIARAVAPVLAESERLRAGLVSSFAILRAVSDVSEAAAQRRRFGRQSFTEASADDAAVNALAGVRAGINRVLSDLLRDLEILQNAPAIWKASPAIEPWAELRARLIQDPQAPLPATSPGVGS
jgi:hypothetical protein